ncbi:MAG: FixH family protein [Xanthobacteraceae bacterium]|nr:FixH family protein [Xanthobacteraceae bacterium]
MAEIRATMTTRCGGAEGREVTGRTVFVCLVTFFAIITAVNAVMMTAAITTFGGVETASSYQAGLAFARQNAAVLEQDRLGWQVVVGARSDGAVTPVIEIIARDRANEPLFGLQASGRLAHPMDKRADRVLAWRETGTGVFRADSGRAVGQWDLVIELSQDGVLKFRSRNRLTLR